ncbi:hypothetical protein IKG54_00550, partial [Candidatus Saccharibacteria bacterium]|nr:hypothetical protein [Candidatus Saccharibacteria bacterium]
MDPKDDDKNIGQQHWDNLVGAESSAAEEKSKDNPDLDTSKVEDTPSNKIAVDLSSKGQQGNTKQKKGFKGFIKKKLPALLIILALAGGGGAILGSQSMQGFAIINRAIQEFNSMGTVNEIRSNALMMRIFNKIAPSADEKVKGTVFDSDNFKLGDAEIAAFKSNNMDVTEVDLGDGSKVRFIKYTDSDGIAHSITGDADSVSKLKGVGLDDAIDFKTAKASVPDFDTKFTGATATYSGQNGRWYNNLTNKFLKRIGFGRNRFSGYESTGDNDTDTENFKKIAKNQEMTEGTELRGDKEVEEPDPDAEEEAEPKRTKKKGVPYDTDAELNEPASEGQIKSTDTPDAIEEKVTAKANKIASAANTGVNVKCTLMTLA